MNYFSLRSMSERQAARQSSRIASKRLAQGLAEAVDACLPQDATPADVGGASPVIRKRSRRTCSADQAGMFFSCSTGAGVCKLEGRADCHPLLGWLLSGQLCAYCIF